MVRSRKTRQEPGTTLPQAEGRECPDCCLPAPMLPDLRGMSSWSSLLHFSLSRHTDPTHANAMHAYMKGHFPFFGVNAPERRAIVKELMHHHGIPPLDELPATVRSLFAFPEREMHQVAVDLLIKYAKKLGPDDLLLVEEAITAKSWWDSVDPLAVHVVGVILKRYPAEIPAWNERWVASTDIWLNRTAIIFQLHWKKDTDQALLFANIDRHAAHTDLFIGKAIGWALCSLGGTDPDAVRSFVASRHLSPISTREALRKLGTSTPIR